MGRVRIPSMTALGRGPSFSTPRAAHTPRKKHNTVATAPVFREIHKGDQSRSPRIVRTSSMASFASYRLKEYWQHDARPPERALKRPSRRTTYLFLDAGKTHSILLTKR